MLETRGLNKAFGSLRVTDNLNLTVSAGSRHCIIGPNGAGKSTLVNLLAGDLLPDSGEVVFDGRSITRLKAWQRAELGLRRTYQIASGFPSLSLVENLLLSLRRPRHVRTGMFTDRFAYRDDISKASQYLRQAGFSGDLMAPVGTLSYGEMKQLELAMALSSHPRILVLDEPLAGVSKEESSRIVSVIRSIPREITLILIEHDMDAVFQIADTITVLLEGRELMTAAPQEIQSSREVRVAYLGE